MVRNFSTMGRMDVLMKDDRFLELLKVNFDLHLSLTKRVVENHATTRADLESYGGADTGSGGRAGRGRLCVRRQSDALQEAREFLVGRR
jgi:hypothetical protein